MESAAAFPDQHSSSEVFFLEHFFFFRYVSVSCCVVNRKHETRAVRRERGVLNVSGRFLVTLERWLQQGWMWLGMQTFAGKKNGWRGGGAFRSSFSVNTHYNFVAILCYFCFGKQLEASEVVKKTQTRTKRYDLWDRKTLVGLMNW